MSLCNECNTALSKVRYLDDINTEHNAQHEDSVPRGSGSEERAPDMLQ